ncbi:MAG: site-specific integrase [Prolixibacteraceae bacterium]|nr:site-specific integrase [Prolixibacteraceae bacterium]
MSESENFTGGCNNNCVVQYLPAEIHTGKECYIDYYVLKPGSNSLHRKKIKLNRQRKKLSSNDFKRYCRAVIRNLNEKLAAGWNPFLENAAAKGFTPLPDALAAFERVKFKDMKKNSVRSYKSFIKILLQYITKKFLAPTGIFSVNFGRSLAQDFLNSKYLSGEISAKTYNNYIKGYHSIFAWLVEYGYTNYNPFDGIKPKKARRKWRAEIPETLRNNIRKHLEERGERAYWLMCELCFWGLARPSEICKMKVVNVNFEKQIILLEDTKNDKERICTLPLHVTKLMKIHLATGGSSIFIFSDTQGFLPGNNEMDPRKISKRWARLRKELNFDEKIQFYSLRDSGIIRLMELGINPEYVRAQADHYSLEMTTKYSKHYRPEGITEIKKL